MNHRPETADELLARIEGRHRYPALTGVVVALAIEALCFGLLWLVLRVGVGLAG